MSLNKEKMSSLLDSYFRQLRIANDCLVVYKSLCNATKEYYDELQISPAFFCISLEAVRYTLCMETTKLFVGNQNSEQTLKRLLNQVKGNLQTLDKKDISALIDENQSIQVYQYEIDIKNEIQKYERELNTLEPVIDKLKTLRDKLWAHSDKEYYMNPEKLVDEFPITVKEIEDLLDFAERFCGRIKGLVDRVGYGSRSSNADDLMQLLITLRKRE